MITYSNEFCIPTVSVKLPERRERYIRVVAKGAKFFVLTVKWLWMKTKNALKRASRCLFIQNKFDPTVLYVMFSYNQTL